MVFYELLVEIGYYPAAAKYILLLNKVCRTFFFYGSIYIGLVIAPAISFYLMILKEAKVYPTGFLLLPKTVVMFLGEVLLFEVSQSVNFTVFEIAFFFLFCFFLVIVFVLMNLLIALAIVDTTDSDGHFLE